MNKESVKSTAIVLLVLLWVATCVSMAYRIQTLKKVAIAARDEAFNFGTAYRECRVDLNNTNRELNQVDIELKALNLALKAVLSKRGL